MALYKFYYYYIIIIIIIFIITGCLQAGFWLRPIGLVSKGRQLLELFLQSQHEPGKLSQCSKYDNSTINKVRLSLVFTITMVKTIVFVSIIILFLSFQTKFIGQTCNIYRYGPLVDLITLTHFQRP